MGNTTTSGDVFDPPTDTSTAPKSATAPAVFADGTPDLYGLGNNSYFVGTSSGAQGPSGNLHDAVNAETGSSYASAEKILNQMVSLAYTDPNAFANVQAEMYNAGKYTSKPTWGVWSAKDGDALGEALRGYMAFEGAGLPVSFTEWLSEGAKVGAAEGGPDGGTATGGSSGSPITVTDPDTLEADANTAAQTNLGRNLTTAEQQPFVKQFQGQEVAAQEAGAGSIVAEPSRYDAPNAATQYLQTNDNAEYQNHLQADYAERMLSMLGVQSS